MSLTKVTYSMIQGEVVNVLDFGAVGDGATNSTTPIQNAIDSIPSGGVVFFPSGTYIINSTVLLNDNITLAGEGSSTIFTYTGPYIDPETGTVAGMFGADSKENIGFIDLKWESNGSDSLTSKFKNCDNVFFERCQIDCAATSHVIYSLGCSLLNVNQCQFFNGREFIQAAKEEFSTGQNTKAVKITNSSFTNNTYGASWQFPTQIYFRFVDEVIVDGCEFTGYKPTQSTVGTWRAYAIYQGDGECTTISISNCRFNQTASDGTGQGSTGVLTSNAEYSQVTNSTFTGFQTGIRSPSTYAVIANNILDVTEVAISQLGSGTVRQFESWQITGNVIEASTDVIWVGFTGIFNEVIAKTIIVSNNIIRNVQNSGIVARGILLSGYRPEIMICNNLLLDGNLSNGTTSPTDSGIAVFGLGANGLIDGNIVKNSPGVGGYRYAIRQAASDGSMVIGENNVFGNMFVATVDRTFTTPTKDFWSKGDRFPFWGSVAAGGAQGSICVFNFDTTLTATEPAGETSMAVTSGTGTANADIIGVEQNNGTVHWTTIASGGGTTTLVLTSAITGDADSGNKVWVYRWKNYGSIAA